MKKYLWKANTFNSQALVIYHPVFSHWEFFFEIFLPKYYFWINSYFRYPTTCKKKVKKKQAVFNFFNLKEFFPVMEYKK